MITYEQLLAGSDAGLPLLEECDLGRISVDDQLVCFKGILTALESSEEIGAALRERDARLRRDNPAVAHLLGLATADKGNMTKYLIACGGEGGGPSGNGYKVWVNKYTGRVATSGSDAILLDPNMRPYVERLHHHRFGLASKQIGRKGTGYGAVMFLRRQGPETDYRPLTSDSGLDDWREFMGSCTSRIEATYGPGDVWTMHHDEAHSLRQIKPGTITFVIETASQRNCSVQFSDEGFPQKLIPSLVDARGIAFNEF